jgi:antitoxin (DNA-binding transcriptional repressor) of toxin-antitoxin stability system
MPSVNLRQLRDTRQLKAWLEAGETVELRERNRVLGEIVPRRPQRRTPKEWPDFAARLKEMWGDRVFDNQQILDEIREDRF